MNNSIESRLDNGVQRLAEQSKTASANPRDGAAKGTEQDRGAHSAKPADHLDITDRARTLASIEEHVRKAPDVDSQRVMDLKQALKDGTYEINPSRIADKLLALDALLPE